MSKASDFFAGGGGGAPINGVRKFYSPREFKLTTASGEVWLETGYIETDVASYPDAEQFETYNLVTASVSPSPTSVTGMSEESGVLYLLGTNDDTVYKYDYSTFAAQGSIAISSMVSNERDLTVLGNKIYICSSTGFIKRHSIAGAVELVSSDLSTDNTMNSIGNDGTNIYTADQIGWSSVDPVTLVINGSMVLPEGGMPSDIETLNVIGSIIYLISTIGIYKYDKATGKFLGTSAISADTGSLNAGMSYLADDFKLTAVDSSDVFTSGVASTYVGTYSTVNPVNDPLRQGTKEFLRIK